MSAKIRAVVSVLCAVSVVQVGTAADPEPGLVRLAPLTRAIGPCVTPEQRADAHRQIDAYIETYGPLSSPSARGTPPPMTFFPIGGNLYRDIFMGAFVDLDPSPGWFDFDCTDWTRDTHAGIDAGPRTFAEKRIGVPVFAAQDGVVIATNDGEFDENTNGAPTPGNYVFIDHGYGQVGYYYHLGQFSVAVSVGEHVTAGRQIGLAASSGYSFGPHLHFGLERDGVIYEPFAGPCRPGPSGWSDQPAIERSHYFWDFGITHEDLSTFPWWPEPFPRDGQLAITDAFMEFWVLGVGLPADSNWRVQFRRPDGVVTFDSFTIDMGNADPVQWYLTWWHYPLDIIPDIQSVTGTWTVMLDINGERTVDAPLEMRAARTPDFNRPPEAITVGLDPASPTDSDVVLCRVDTSQTLDDVDYDVVRYHYVWRVNGQVVRDVVSAGQADVIPRGTAGPCDLVECDVTPNDGDVDGPLATTSVVVAAACPGDLDHNGDVSLSDLAALLANFNTPSGAGYADGDLDCDGDVDLADLAALLAHFGAPCE